MDREEIRSEADEEDRPTSGVDSSTAAEPAPRGESRAAQAIEMSVGALSRGQIVDGLIVHIDDQGALVDVGTKSEGHIPVDELAGGMTEDGKPLAVGDRVAVYVVRPEDEEGSPVLSKKRADYERVWHRLGEAFEQGRVLSAMVTDRVRGGLVVDLGMRGFLPASHVRTRNVHALDRFVGQTLKVKIIEVDRARKRVVVSHKDAVEEERRRRREQVLATVQESQVYKGVVRRITDYGAFVDLGGVDGLLHVTEMSWTRIDHPGDVVKVGDKIDVMVLRFDRQQNRISLGLKQILPDPWEDVREQFRVGQTVTATVSRLVPFGAFVRLENGVEAIIPNSELPGERGQRAQDVLTRGQSLEAKIINIRPSERRMTLSLRQAQQAQERRQLREYMQRQQESSRVTIGDLVGDVFSEAQARQEEEAQGEPETTEVTWTEETETEPETEEGVPERPTEVGEEAAASEAATDIEEGTAPAEPAEQPSEVEEASARNEQAKESGEGEEWSSSESPEASEAEKG